MKLPEPPFGDHPGISDITMALNYQCNSRCTFCFIEPELELGLTRTPLDYLEGVFAENRRTGAFERIIFSGAEATLRKDLPRIVEAARAQGGYQHVRIQTNARRLADAAYLQTLIDAGLDEYFVSIHAPTAELDAALTRRPASFEQMRAGIANILAAGARLISNTCVTAGNVQALPALADFLLAEGVPESQIWNFVEFGDIGQTDSHVPFEVSIPQVVEAARRLETGGNDVSLSWWPACLLGEWVRLLDNHRAYTVIHPVFAERMAHASDFRCVYAGSCKAFGDPCIGVHERYRAVHGDERDRLRPFEKKP